MAKESRNAKTTKEANIESREKIMNSIRTISPLSDDDTNALFELIAKGKDAPKESADYKLAQDARVTLARHNLRLVMNIANSFKPNEELFDDLLQEGYIILYNVIPKFDASKGYKFSTYAGNCLRRGLNDYFNKVTNNFSIPRDVPAEINKVKKTMDELDITCHDDASLMRVCEATGFPLSKVKDLLNTQYNFISFDTDGENEEANKISDRVADTRHDSIDDLIDDTAFFDNLNTIYRFLDKRESLILSLYLGLDNDEEVKTRDIANKFGLSMQRVRQIIKNALTKLRENPYAQQLLTPCE